ncbi:MAG: DUF1284 domain-containing protein [Roseibium sp.]
MTVSLRPHHLLCLLTYLGKGYTEAFVRNYSMIVGRLNRGEDIRLVEGPDDICLPMLTETGCHCRNDSVRQRDAQALKAIRAVLGANRLSREVIEFDAEAAGLLRQAFADGTLRAACQGCEWHALCSRIALNEFRGCHLAPPV